MIRLLRFVFSALYLLVLAGCAGQQLYRQGEDLVAQGQYEQGIQRLEEALRIEPTNAQFRSSLVLTREHAITDWLDNASRAQSAGDNVAANAWLARVAAVAPDHPRVVKAAQKLSHDELNTKLLARANTMVAAEDFQGAMALAQQILAQDPMNRQATNLARELGARLAKPLTEPPLADGFRKPVTIEFKDAPIRQVFEVFARSAGLNFVFDKDVRADLKTTVFFRNSTVESAMKMLLLTNQLEYKVLDAHSVLIYPNTPAKSREYQTLIGKAFFLNNADAKLVVAAIKAIVKTRDIVADERQNLVIMRDSPEAVRMAERLVAMQDLAEPEVMLEVEVLEVKRSKLLDLGINWPGQLALTPLASATGGVVTLNDLRNLNGSRIGASLGATTINANRTLGDTNLLANPRIRSKNKEKARIMVGDKVPNITTTSTSTGFVSETVQYIDVGLKLEVEPTIFSNDEVMIKVALEVSNIVSQIQTTSGTLAYQIGSRNATAVLRLKDGENQVLAGLISDEDRSTANRIPGLGDIPILGRLFGSQRDQKDKTEIVLSITPRLVRGTMRPLALETEFFAGTDASLRNSSAEFGISPASTAAISVATRASNPIANGPATSDAVAPGRVALEFQGPSAVRVGGTFSMQLNMRAAEPVSSVPVTLNYDARLLEVVSVNEGSYMRRSGGRSTFTSQVDRATGQIFATASRVDNSDAPGGPGDSAAGSLLTVVFRALSSAPEVRTQMASATPVGPTGRPLITGPLPLQTLAIVP